VSPRRSRSRGASRPTHVDERGRLRMVDVGSKQPTLREAVAEGRIGMSASAFGVIRRGALGKGEVLTAARLAGIAAAKRTADLIPLCHVIPLDHVSVDLRLEPRTRSVLVLGTARARWSTGVEMEAMVAVAAALLTIYDMAKAIDRGMSLGPIRLLRKSGGRSGDYRSPQEPGQTAGFRRRAGRS
jgi:cyclic pyranopterin monophosphate synthase